MGDPALAVAHRKYGRLYRWPGSDLPVEMRPQQMNEALREGLLVPSVTNVIGVRSKDYLQGWYSRHAARAALEVLARYPDRVRERPADAKKWIADAGTRDLNSASERGTRVHDACESLARGLSLPDGLNDDELGCVASWRAFLAAWKPEWLHLEATCFGEVDGHRYAGTGDFFARINGLSVIGDYKCVVLATPVLMADGTTVPASDLREGDMVVAWTEEKGLHPAPVAWVADNGPQETYRIKTVGGWEVQVTAEHPFLVRRKRADGKGVAADEWAKADGLRAGDQVHLALGWDGSCAEDTVSTGDAYLLGLLAGASSMTGGMTGECEWSFTNADPGVVRVAHEHLAVHGVGLVPVKGAPDDYLIGCGGAQETGVAFPAFVEAHGFRCGPHDKRVPVAVRRGSAGVRAAFLSGLLDTTGHVRGTKDRARVSFRSTNRDMAVDVRQLLANSGIRAGLDTVRARNRKEPESHHVVVSDEHDIASLAGLLTLRGEHGQRLGRVAARPGRGTPDRNIVAIISVERVRVLQPTLAIEVEGAHTHVTGGIITHNTNRGGLHTEVGSQLAALAHADRIVLTDGTLAPMPYVEAGVGLHLSADGYQVAPVDLDGPFWNVFRHCLSIWEDHVTEGDGSIRPERKAMGRPLRGPDVLLRSPGRPALEASPARALQGRPGAEPLSSGPPTGPFG